MRGIESLAIGQRLAGLWARLMDAMRESPDGAVPHTAIAGAPVVWLLGKVQSGKSSIVRAITAASAAEIGEGFRPCTRSARVFDYPSAAPVIRFLDTRGLGEAGYDPAEDLAVAERHAQLLLVVMRARDVQQEAVVAAVAAVRRRHPDWPVVVAQTCLHDGYDPGGTHVLPYPFTDDTVRPAGVPEDLIRSLAHQRRLFDAIGTGGPVVFVPVDLTGPEDGFTPQNYGLEALQDAIVAAAPAGLASLLRQIQAAGADDAARRANGLSLGYATAAAAVDVVPIAGAVAVPGVQAKLLHALGTLHGVKWDRRALAEFAGCLGAGVLVRLLTVFGIRQVTKLVPVYGQTAGSAAAAAASFATTFALGKAAHAYLAGRRYGGFDPAPVAEAYRGALAAAFRIRHTREPGDIERRSDDHAQR
jgi:uncharacterized protein (DUF697 family)